MAASVSIGRSSAEPSDEQGSNPLTRHRLTHRFTTPVFVGRARAAFQQEPDDARLLLARVLGTAPSSPGGLNGTVQWRHALCSDGHSQAHTSIASDPDRPISPADRGLHGSAERIRRRSPAPETGLRRQAQGPERLRLLPAAAHAQLDRRLSELDAPDPTALIVARTADVVIRCVSDDLESGYPEEYVAGMSRAPVEIPMDTIRVHPLGRSHPVDGLDSHSRRSL